VKSKVYVMHNATASGDVDDDDDENDGD